jgi:hypothetical protein
MQPALKRQRTQISSINDSFLNLEHIESKGGYRQFYQDLLEQIKVNTNWKQNIQKNSIDCMLDNNCLQQNMIQSKIRNMFDIEFNKKFQGSMQFPLLSMGTLRNQQMKNSLEGKGGGAHLSSLGKSHVSNRYRSNNYTSFDNRYLFFISDKLENDKELERKERAKYQSLSNNRSSRLMIG